MMGIRGKIILVFGGLLAIVAVIVVLTISQIDRLGRSIDVILRENYRSVIACQNMIEALERMDSGVLFCLAGSAEQGREQVAEYRGRFEAALGVELGNITIPGEQESANKIRDLFGRYAAALPSVTDDSRPEAARRTAYFSMLFPLFGQIKANCRQVLEMNQANMMEANDTARRRAVAARRKVFMAIAGCAAAAVVVGSLAHVWILRPIRRLTESTEEIRHGNLDLVLDSSSRDEIGRLSASFNEMASSLRRVRKSDHMKLLRSRRATEVVLDAPPAAVAVLDLDGRVELATDTAKRQFGLRPGAMVADLGMDWLTGLVRNAAREERAVELSDGDGCVQRFFENREHFFHPIAVPIPVDSETKAPSGIAVILKDVTQVHEQQELKRGVVSTVSHQLKTPLKSLRMSIHLLLEERTGALNDKQAELLLAARDESDRLAAMIEDLLDLNRMSSGKAPLAVQALSPRALARDAVEPYLSEARDKGIHLVNSVPEDLPDVKADVDRIRHVFANLLSNALRFTTPGGTVTVVAALKAGVVEFAVDDTGRGIAEEHLAHMFEQFYRVPGQPERSGAGLGLAIVKEIVQAHGGEVGASSDVGKGTTFRFTLPVEGGNVS